MSKQEAFKIVFEELSKCPLFVGTFDAKNGSSQYIHGVCTVMENIALNVSEETYNEYINLWTDNVIKSIEGEEND